MYYCNNLSKSNIVSFKLYNEKYMTFIDLFLINRFITLICVKMLGVHYDNIKEF